MSLRSVCRLWLWAVVLLALSAGPSAAQPPGPLELVRGLRENGQLDLAMEYLKEIEGKPLTADDKASLLLERAKCLLEASEDEPDEGTRLGMIAEAKEGLNAFVQNYPNHPRAVEGTLTSAKLTSLDAKEVLARARKIDVPPVSDDAEENNARRRAQEKQKAEAFRAQPKFLLASKLFAQASAQLRARIEDKALNVTTRKALEREAFEAELASGINLFNIAETYTPGDVLTVGEKEQRNKFLEQAKEVFVKLGKGPSTSRAVWVARAWYAEVTYEQNDFKTAADEVAAVLRASVLEAEDGKRLARFFQLRRNARSALEDRVQKKIDDSIKETRGWLGLYGNPRKPTPEVFAVKYYLARTLHFVAEASTVPKAPGGKPLDLGATARGQLEEAEKIYRALSQSDHEYTARAAKYRMHAVRRLLGEADQNPLAYPTFEKAQMASMIQLNKLVAAEAKAERLAGDPKADPKKLEEARAEAKAARGRVIALLERAREIATDQDRKAQLNDVIDVELRLIYFYQANEQFYQAAVLGDYGARTIRSTGGKAATAGLLGLNAYLAASKVVKGDGPEVIAAAQQADRERAVALARFLDEKYPNDNATDSVRLQLADMLQREKRYMDAYDVLVKVRPGFARLTSARLMQAYVVAQLVTPLDSKLSKEDKARLFRKATSDLNKVPKPADVATEEEVRAYLSARCRLASMMFVQERADPETEARDAGFNQALFLAEKIVAEVPTFDSMADKDKKLNIDGMEMHFLALDTYTRALYLRARAMTNNNQFDGALDLIKPVLDQVAAGGPLVNDQMREWAAGAASDDPDTKQKARIAQLAGGVDKNRVDVILAGFRVQARRGKAAEAGQLLDLLVKAGGTIEDSLPLLEPVGRELAALKVSYQKEGKTEDAKNLDAGLGVLLDKIRAVKTLSVPSLLFIAQTLQSIGKNAEALETARKVPAPTYKDWDKKKTDEFPEADRGKVVNQIRDHALAQFTAVKAMTELKQFAEAEKMLKEIVGETGKPPGWGANRLYFRKALAELYEAKGTNETEAKKAQPEWAQAVREWGTLFNMQRGRLTAMGVPPAVTGEKLAQQLQAFHDAMAWTEWFHGAADALIQAPQARNAFADAFFDVQRATVAANQQLLKNAPDKLQKNYEDVGKRIADIEKQIHASDWQPEVQNRYFEFLKANPPILKVYQDNGGKLFLTKMPLK
ncbi:MAG: hypothetical protein ACKODX_18475 [Gemmata sp.]